MKGIPVVILIFLVAFGVFGVYIYSYNLDSVNADVVYEQQVNEIKIKQVEYDREFTNEQRLRGQKIIQTETQKNFQDNDGDGLSYAKELELGTSDNERDSDADGILDSQDEHPAGGGENYKITVNWQHNGLPYTTQFGIPEDLYLYYKNYPRAGYYYQDGRFATPYDLVIRTIAEDITDVSISSGNSNKFSIAVDFVESMTYQYDINFNRNSDYPKYAIETIIDERGDCEDTSFLMASILEALNIDTVLLLFSDHMAVGVYCTWCTGSYYEHNGRKYFFLETTGEAGSWELGRAWGKYTDESAKIIEV